MSARTGSRLLSRDHAIAKPTRVASRDEERNLNLIALSQTSISYWYNSDLTVYFPFLPSKVQQKLKDKIIKVLDEEKVRADLLEVYSIGIRTIAVVLLHSWKNPDHELAVARIALETGFDHVSVSHQVLPLIRIVSRGQTTLIDAYLATIFNRYRESILSEIGNIDLEFMKGSGGLAPVKTVLAKDTILSGPAGGVIGTAHIAGKANIQEAIGFDMGGTSTDVSRFGGEFHRVYETVTGGIQYQTDQLDVETVAAGGGSILTFDGQKFIVGPASAGADPGPACYGLGGPLTITDANLVLGRVYPDLLPPTFGPDNDQQLDSDITRKKFEQLTSKINQVLGTGFSIPEVAEGFVQVANQIMSRAIKKISVSRGYDIREHALVCFGGAAPQHACSIARMLGIRHILIPPLAGVLSAYGIAVAERTERTESALMIPYSEDVHPRLIHEIKGLEMDLKDKFPKMNRNRIKTRIFLDLRPAGSDAYLTIQAGKMGKLSSSRKIIRRFEKLFQQRYGFINEQNTLELVNLRMEASLPEKGLILQSPGQTEGTNSGKDDQLKDIFVDGKSWPAPVYFRDQLGPGTMVKGPAFIMDPYATIVVDPGFTATINDWGLLEIRSVSKLKQKASTARDPVLLEVFNHLFMSIAEQMGYTLANTAFSVNIKERLDFSCAVFDPDGNLVANAPHIPVHLGSMGESVRYICRDYKGRMNEGDMFVSNNPHHGGTHLPDVTVVAPVFCNSNKATFFVASRGHHADIGGITPGSMPPFATCLEEEGIVIDHFLLVSKNRFKETEICELLSSGQWPVRNLEERIADLKAQVAANQKGISELVRLVAQYGLDTVTAYMSHIQDNATEAMIAALKKLTRGKPGFEGSFEDYLDDGTRISVKIRISRKSNSAYKMHIDFSGTDPEMPGNLNAPVAVTKSAVLYVLRTLIDRDIPLNEGCLRPIEIVIPEGSILNPSKNAAVGGGNVETSQRVVDTLYGALGITAASQGTMNNFLFGRQDGKGSQYYETIAGGAGALEGHDGASAVQVHMTNTRMTDPEVLEYRFPEVSLEQFEIRHGTGGKGKWTGGNGVIRAIRFHEPMHISILSERRNYPPFGMDGGKPGSLGKNQLVKKDGSVITLNGKVEQIVQPGDTIVIQTPGGGGFGKPD
ncbi:MAG: hydantoinase B/oxoprolinase family protein [Candidatus Marinimicrobia bacterium]|nr:hydantoinase B/oxoprolinase family protein [Candidatus Neomarinimicrobiota bacterium]